MLTGISFGTKADRIAAAIVGGVFAALLGFLARKLWLAACAHHPLDFSRGRVVAVACVFTLASAASLCICGLALWQILRRQSGAEMPQASAPTVIPTEFLGRPFGLGIAIQGILLFSASMVLDCGVFFSTCLSAFALWDVVLVLLRRRAVLGEGDLYSLVAMLVPVMFFVLAWEFHW